jgi:RNA polymerase sigma factor (sigma-70 family)
MPHNQRLAPGLDGAGDPELIALVRDGYTAAYEELFVRHRDVALRLARRLADAEKADDIVSEAFAKILDLLQRGKGPDVAFRAYLLTTVRTVHLNLVRSARRESATDDNDLEGVATPVDEDADARFDEGAIARAFRQLPERWQSALWMTAVEGLPNEEVSRHLGIQANAVASLAFRARAGLRQAYLAEHLRETASAECTRIVDLLPSYLRGSLTPRRRHVVEAHLDRCSRCSVAAAELADVDRRLGALIAPAVVGVAAATAMWPATAGAPAAPVSAGVLAGIKGTGSSLLGALTTGTSAAKVAVLVAIAATSIGVSAHQLLATDHATPRTAPEVSTVTTGVLPPLTQQGNRLPGATPSDGSVPLLVGSTPSAEPWPGVSSSAEATPNTPPSTAPSSEVTPSTKPTPTPTPTPTDTATPTPPPSAQAMRVEAMSSNTVSHDNITWHRVSVPVADAPAGSTLVMTAKYILGTDLVPGTSGWTCTKPKLSWIDATYLSSSRTSCTYDGTGDGSSLKLDYWIGAGTTVQGALTSPAGFVDTSTADNAANLHLG